MAYARINYTGVHKGKVQLVISMYLEETDPNYDKHYVYVPVFPEKGYSGKVDEFGIPIDQVAYDAWVAALPHVWQNNPFHNHMIYGDPTSVDSHFKDQIAESLNYFYLFHQRCWAKSVPFIEDWKKVPKVKGTIRCPFVKGDLSPKNIADCELKAIDIKTRELEILPYIVPITPVDLNIGDKGTIDIGGASINRGSYFNIMTYTSVDKAVPANASGSIDTVDIYGSTYCAAGNDVWAGVFSASGNVLTCRDSESLGQISVGANQFTGLAITVESGDYIGTKERNAKTTYIEWENSGGSGVWTYAGEYIDPTDTQTFTLSASRAMSLHGTGTEAAAGWSHDFLGVANASIGNIMGVAIADVGNVCGVA